MEMKDRGAGRGREEENEWFLIKNKFGKGSQIQKIPHEMISLVFMFINPAIGGHPIKFFSL